MRKSYRWTAGLFTLVILLMNSLTKKKEDDGVGGIWEEVIGKKGSLSKNKIWTNNSISEHSSNSGLNGFSPTMSRSSGPSMVWDTHEEDEGVCQSIPWHLFPEKKMPLSFGWKRRGFMSYFLCVAPQLLYPLAFVLCINLPRSAFASLLDHLHPLAVILSFIITATAMRWFNEPPPILVVSIACLNNRNYKMKLRLYPIEWIL